VHAGSRVVAARHPAKPHFDVFWIVAGRVVDWGPLPGSEELWARTRAAVERRSPAGRVPPVPVDEVDELRIVSSWLAAHDTTELALSGRLSRPDVERFSALLDVSP